MGFSSYIEREETGLYDICIRRNNSYAYIEKGGPDYPEALQRTAGHARKTYTVEREGIWKAADHTWKISGKDGCTDPDR